MGGGLSKFVTIEITTATPIIAIGNKVLKFLFKREFLSLGYFASES
jgi:hypothetical protein